MAPNITVEISSEAWLDGWIETLQSLQEPLTLLTDGLKRGVSSALEGKALSREEAYLLINATPAELPSLCKAAAIIRDRGKGRTISFSPKVFIPLTRLCRDFCGYCTFRQSPAEAESLYMSPEQRYTEAKEWLHRHGYRTTLEYLHDACALVLQQTSLLPHGNPGTMTRR